MKSPIYTDTGTRGFPAWPAPAGGGPETIYLQEMKVLVRGVVDSACGHPRGAYFGSGHDCIPVIHCGNIVAPSTEEGCKAY